MKFIKDMDNDLVNLEVMEYIYIVDMGEDHKDRFEVRAYCKSDAYILKKYRTEDGAKKFLKKIYEGDKYEAIE